MKCALCDNTERFKKLLNKESIRFGCYGHEKGIYKCLDCELVFLAPPWDEDELAVLYRNYNNHWQDFSGQKRQKTVSPYLTEYCPNSTKVTLEIGHGKGDNVKFLRKKGFDVHGIDKDKTCCDGKNLIHSDYREHIDLVDFVYAIQVFEHIPDPLDFIHKTRGFLKPGGRFLLEVPNLDDPLLTIYHNKYFKGFYFYPYHVYFYTEKTMSRLMEKAGVKFKIKRVQRYGLTNHLRWLLKGSPGNSNPHIPVVDDVYKWLLTEVFRKSDTLLVIGEK